MFTCISRNKGRRERNLLDDDLVVNVLPIIQGNQLKGGEHRPQEIIEVGVTVVWIRANAETSVVLVTVPGK